MPSVASGQGSAMVASKRNCDSACWNLVLLRRQAFLRGGRLAPRGAQSSTGNTGQLQPASIVAVTATWCWTSKPPGTDTLKSHLPGSRGKTNLIAAFVVPKRPWVLWVNPRGTKQAHLRKSFRGHLHATDSAAQTCCPGSHHVPLRSQTPRGEPRLQNIRPRAVGQLITALRGAQASPLAEEWRNLVWARLTPDGERKDRERGGWEGERGRGYFNVDLIVCI